MRRYLAIFLLLVIPAILWATVGSDDWLHDEGGTTLGTNWTVGNTDFGDCRILSSQAYASTGQCDGYWNPFTPGNDQYSQFAIGTFSPYLGLTSYLIADVRQAATGSNPDRYRCMAAKNDAYYGGKTALITVISGGSESIIGSDATATWVPPDVLKCEVIGDQKKLYRNGSVLVTAGPDATLASGNIGIEIYTEDDPTVVTFGPWQGGDNPVAGATRHRPIIVQ